MADPAPPAAPAVPVRDQLKDEGHAFDGIQEYDNNLPRWWLMLFYATIVFAPIYILFYHFGPGKLGRDRLKDDLAVLTAERAKLNGGTQLDEAGLRALTRDPVRIAHGKELYLKISCIACHGPEGLGLVGPNLRDSHWICEPTMTGITTVLEKGGRVGKGMPPAATDPEGRRDLAAFIVSLNRAGHKDNPAKPAAADEPERTLDW